MAERDRARVVRQSNMEAKVVGRALPSPCPDHSRGAVSERRQRLALRLRRDGEDVLAPFHVQRVLRGVDRLRQAEARGGRGGECYGVQQLDEVNVLLDLQLYAAVVPGTNL
jgi:hypothetical protein